MQVYTTPFVILALGKTGLGKSTMANILCGADAKTSSGADACTQTAALYRSRSNLSRAWKCYYIDTKGLNDTEGGADKDSFAEILKLMFANKADNVFKVDLILWFVSDDVRATNELKQQAEFIQKNFATNGDFSDNIWDTVLIVSKGSVSANNWADGAISAARTAYGNESGEFNLPSFRCWIMGKCQSKDDSQQAFELMFKDKSSTERHMLNLYKEEEIREAIISRASERRPYSVKFELIKCRKCNVTTDPRILDGPCHVDKKLVHPGTVQGYHKGERAKVHTNFTVIPHVVDGIKLGFRYGFIPGAAVLGVFGLFYWGKWCKGCGEDVATPGCTNHCDSCRRKWEDGDPCGSRWSCCKAEVGEEPSCKTICSDCDGEWATTPGCNDSSNHELYR